MRATITRLQSSNVQTLGEFNLYNGIHKVFSCKTLELPDRANKNNISRIPQGVYTCVRRFSTKYGLHYHVQDVENRTLILIHNGNYHYQTRGCILVGLNFYDINNDGLLDITSSVPTMKAIRSFRIKQFQLTIID